MAADPKLIVALEARLNKFEKDLKRAGSVADREVGNIERRFVRANKQLSGSFTALGAGLRGGLGALGIGLGAAAGVRAIALASDEFVKLQNTLRITGLEGADLERVMGQLFQIAQKNGTALSPLATLYSRVSQSQRELNATSDEMLKFTEGVSLALRVAGTDSQAASGALLQLSQAMGGGVIQAQEFNSLIDGARPVLQAVAAGLEEAGGSVAKLTRLVKDQQVSSEAFFRAFLAGAPLLEKQASKMSATVGQSTERMANAFLVFVGKLDEVTGSSKNTAQSLSDVASVIEKMPDFIDKAVAGLSDLRSWLNQAGANPFWTKLGKAMGLTFSDAEARAAGLVTFDPSFAGSPEAQREAARARAFSGLPSASTKPVSTRDHPAGGTGSKGDKGNTVGVDSFERALAQARKQLAALNAETSAIGQNAAARERATLIAELETAAKAANAAAGVKGTEITATQAAEIQNLAGQMEVAASAAEQAQQNFDQFNSTLQFAGSHLVDIFAAIGDKSQDMRDVVVSSLRSMARAFLELAITGGGPFGKAIPGGGVGGLLGALFPFPGRAAGGPVAANSPYIVGERGPEVFVPKTAGNIVPNSIARKAGNGGVTVIVNSAPVFQAGMTPTDMAAIDAKMQRNNAELRGQIITDIRRGQRNDSSFLSG